MLSNIEKNVLVIGLNFVLPPVQLITETILHLLCYKAASSRQHIETAKSWVQKRDIFTVW